MSIRFMAGNRTLRLYSPTRKMLTFLQKGH